MTLSMPPIAATPARTLIVEDEGLVADHLAGLLSTSGYNVVGIAESSHDALAQVSELRPDLILMDIRIKGSMDGIETTAKLRESFDIPVVYLTAHTDLQTIGRAKLTGAFGFLTKPIDSTILGITIEMAINRHRADRDMRHQRSWMATVLGTMADALAVVDKDGKIQFLNGPAEAITGWTVDQCRDTDIETVLPLRYATSNSHANEVLSPPLEPRPPREMPRGLIASRRSGERFPIDGAISPCIDDDGTVVGAVITFRDATFRQAQDNERRHRDKMEALGRLAAGIAHDFNNLLFVILGYVEEMLTTTTDVPGRRALSEIRKAGTSAANVAQQLLKFSRKQPVQKEDLDLNAVIRDAEELLRRTAGPAVTWQLKLGKALGAVRADEEQMKQVLMNLAANARDAMSGRGKVTIETMNLNLPRPASFPGETEPFVALSVTDTGIGMSAETAEHLFEPFFTTKQPGGGTGLGLSIVDSIVTDHGGTIHVDSTAGRGATFTVYLPRTAGTTDRPVIGEPDTREVAGAPTVLLVEDQAAVRRLLFDYLISAGSIVLEAGDGEEAIRLAGEHPGLIDLLITDVKMPGASGFEVARTLARKWEGMKTLFISGYAQELADGIENLPPGARFLPKPFARSEFLQNVNALLPGRVRGAAAKSSGT